MAAPPEKKGRTGDSVEEKESTTITMVLQRWAKGQKEQFSPVYRIKGFPFRLRMRRESKWSGRDVDTYVVCDKSREAELWMCTATITEFWPQKQKSYKRRLVFCSWEEDEWKLTAGEKNSAGSISSEVGSSVQITIVVEEGKNSWSSPSLRPTIDSTTPADGILVIGEEKKEIRVNKEFLASQSPFFDRLFFGDFKEKNMDKIPIGDVKYEEFHNIIEMVYGSYEASLTDNNLYNVLDLADRFELKERNIPILNSPDLLDTYVVCDKWKESELWKCTANITLSLNHFLKHISCRPMKRIHTYCSWGREYKNPWDRHFLAISIEFVESVQVTIAVKEKGDKSWFCHVRPAFDSINPPNGILVIGEEKKEIHVNKEFLASQSPFFDRLFFGDFMEKNMDKIPIGDVEYEEFNDIIEMVYGFFGTSLTDENVHEVLDLADRFDLKIVEDKVVSYLLSPRILIRSKFSLAQKLLLSQERNIPFLKYLRLKGDYDLRQLVDMKKEPEYADFSSEMKAEILDLVLTVAHRHLKRRRRRR